MKKHIRRWNRLAARHLAIDESAQMQLPFGQFEEASPLGVGGDEQLAEGFDAWCMRMDHLEREAAAAAFVAITLARSRAREVA